MDIEESVVDYEDLNELTKNFMQNLSELSCYGCLSLYCWNKKRFLVNTAVENFVDVDFEETLNVTLVKTGEAIGNFNIKIKKCVSDENGYGNKVNLFLSSIASFN